MPIFYSDEIDLEPDEYLNACNSREIEELIKALIEDGHIKKPHTKRTDKVSINEEKFNESLNKIAANYVVLTVEEEEFINNIAKRL